MPPRIASHGIPNNRSSSSSSGGSGRTNSGSRRQGDVNAEPTKLDQRIMSSAISSGMPTFLLTKGVPIIDRRAKKLVTARTIAKAQSKSSRPENSNFPPAGPLCLRGHTPTTLPPSQVRVERRTSVRGPRGATDIPPGTFLRPGVLGGLSVSPWVVQEETEKAERALAHKAAISKDPLVFRRKRKEGGFLDYAEDMHAVKRFLDKIHPIRDESCPPISGFSYRRVCHDIEPPDVYDTRLDSVRPRTVGYSAGHIRALSPTPGLTWGGRESSKASLEWGEGTGGSLGTVEACLEGIPRVGSTITLQSSKFNRSLATEGFAGGRPGGKQSTRNQDADVDGEMMEPAWPDQGMPHPLPWSPPPGALRPFSSPCDHLGRPMSREVLSRATASLKPQQFDTTQRRCQYTGALAAKREARLSREAADAAAAQLEKERRKNTTEGREGIQQFEGSLKEILKRKWKYL